MASDESVVITAPSVEEAILLGLTRLTATREEVDIEVLDEGNRGFLGLGVREAKVRLSRRPEGATKPAPSTSSAAPVVEPVSESDTRPAAEATDRTAPKAASVAEPAAAELTPPASEERVADKAAPARAPQAGAQSTPTPHPPVSESAVRPAAQAAARSAPKDAATSQPAASELTPPAPETPAEKVDDGLDRERLTAIAKSVAENLLPGMSIETSVEWLDEERPTMWIALDGRDASSLVGPRARNLHAVQYLFRALIYHHLDGEYNVVVDADGYRRRRRRSLESMAEKKAERAVNLGKTMRLRPMPAHERRIVHIVLRKDDRVTTESVGKGRDRAVTIIPKNSGS